MLSCLLIALTIVRASTSWPIVNGEAVQNPEQFRFAVSLQRRVDGKLKHFCGGTHIGRGWILTASHCVVRFETSTIYAFIGGQPMNVSERALVYQVGEKINHPDYNRVTLSGDIALLRVILAKGTDFDGNLLLPANSKHEALHLLNGQEKYESQSHWGPEECHIFGYGASSYKGESHSALQYGSVQWLDHGRCVRMLGSILAPAIPNRGMFCAIGLADACRGDSGGGLVCRKRKLDNWTAYTLRGIISYGAGCGVPASPGVFTDVGYYREWIDQYVSV